MDDAEIRSLIKQRLEELLVKKYGKNRGALNKFASEAGTSAAYAAMWKSAKRDIPRHMLPKIAALLGCPIEYLLGYTGDMTGTVLIAGNVSCGGSSADLNKNQSHLAPTAKWDENLIAYIAIDDGMMPSIQHGDRLTCSPTEPIYTGDLAVINNDKVAVFLQEVYSRASVFICADGVISQGVKQLSIAKITEINRNADCIRSQLPSLLARYHK